MLLVLAGALAWPAVEATPGRAGDLERARASFRAMERTFYDHDADDYRELARGPVGSHAWPFSQALAAQIAVARLPQLARQAAVHARLAALERRFARSTTFTAWPNGSVYLDDNEWIAQDLLDWGDLTGSAAPRASAEAIFAAVTAAWDSSTTHPCTGGVYWTTSSANRDRNTVSTANGALVGLRLYAATKNPTYLTWSQQMLAWLDRCMLAPNGLYWDHIAGSGAVDQTEWSYNEGSVIGANVLLYQTTGNAEALTRAEQLADASLDYFDSRWSTGEPPEFAVIFFRNLLRLAAVDGRQDYVAAAEQYGDDQWQNARDPKSGLFRFGGRTTLLQQAALVQLYAALAATDGS